jgi:hypothetical protein
MANTALRVAELDFDTIKENLKTYLRSQSEFQDFDFEGSGMSVLLDMLAYNTHYMGFYLNMVANEMFLDTAQIRSSVISHAKSIGYVPSSRHGAIAKVTVNVTPSSEEDQNTTIITLDKYTKFLGEDKDGINYPFVAINSNTVSKVSSSFNFANVFIKQGEVVTRQFLMNNLNSSRRFSIPSANVDLGTLSVIVQESSANTFTTQYIKADDITEIRANSAVYFVEEDAESNYVIYFGDNVVGKKPANNNIVICTYLDCVGSMANGISRFTVVDPVGSLFSDNVTVTSVNSSYSGTDKETIEQVRFRAPYAYSVQNRAVIDTDYETLLLKDYNNIDSVSVWGGEENDPVIYGKVFMSIKPKGNYFLSNLDKENIINNLIKTRNVVTVIPEIVDPDYVFLLTRVKVYYDSSLTNLNAGQIQSLVRAAISDYVAEELNDFKSVFKKSKLQQYIENADSSITGSDVQIYAQKKETIVTNQTRNYTFDFGLPLKKGDYIDKLYSFPQLKVLDIENNLRDIFFEEVPNAFTGIDSVTIINPGRNYTSTPTTTISGDGIGASARAIIVNGKVDRIEIINRGVNYTRATVTITGGGGKEATAIAKLEAKNGNLRTYYFKTNGEKVIVNPNAGTVDYEKGFITLTSLNTSEVLENDFYPENILTINSPISRENIFPTRNRILSLDENDFNSIQIEVIAEQ